MTPRHIKTAIQIEQRIDNRKEKREFIKKLAISLRIRPDLSNSDCIKIAFEFSEQFFNELNEKQ